MSRFPDAQFLISAASVPQFPADSGREVAFVGRSNAGKSTAINAITQRRALARTSKTPGRTQLLNFFALASEQRLVDLPGYGYAAVAEEQRRTWAPLIDALQQRRSLCGLFLIVDARRGVQAADENLVHWAGERPVHVLLAKADKLNRRECGAAEQQARDLLDSTATVQLFSAHSGLGVDAARQQLEQWLRG
jgi:GTP-binding protein